MVNDRPERVGVVIPARDEQDLLPACLEAVWRSARACALPVEIVVGLDGCRDASAAVVREFQAQVGGRSGAGSEAGVTVHGLDLRLHNVGRARAAGMRYLLRRHGPDRVWLATTDADSTVPPGWFDAQLAHARAGASVVVGTVQVGDWDGRPEPLRVRAEAAYVADGHRHVHGANLAFTAGAYVRAGGFQPLASSEDVALVRAFVTGGEPTVWATDLAVTTSGRRVGRASGGFAGYLDDLELGSV